MSRHVDEFFRDGYTVVSDLFDEAELGALRQALEDTIARVHADPGAYTTRYTIRNDEVWDTWGVNDILSPELCHPAYLQLFENPALMSVVRDLMGEELRFWAAHALWSPRLVDYDLNWHRDFGDDDRYDPTGASTHVYINVCLADDACFHAIPGSNRRPLTDAERAEQDAMGFASLPDETIVDCRAGDVLFMNGHSFHRGACKTSAFRRTLHIALQPRDEPTGGHGSWKYMRSEGFLETMPPTVRKLMANLIQWEDEHPLDLRTAMRRMRISKEHKEHQARIR